MLLKNTLCIISLESKSNNYSSEIANFRKVTADRTAQRWCRNFLCDQRKQIAIIIHQYQSEEI